MIDLLALEKSLLLSHVKEGGTAVDFTMGNGHDTLWLSNAVGENGRVFAFDIQEQAKNSSEKLLEKEAKNRNYELILASHHRVKEFVSGEICVGMFNLGYLPGGDKRITTMRETTLPAIKAGIELLAPGGALLIAVYPGHAEGRCEGNLIYDMLKEYDRRQYCATKLEIVNSPTSPFFYLLERSERS